MTVATFEMRRPDTSPKVTTVLRFATKTPPIPVTVDTPETQRPNASPKVTTVLRFAVRIPQEAWDIRPIAIQESLTTKYLSSQKRGEKVQHERPLRTCNTGLGARACIVSVEPFSSTYDVRYYALRISIWWDLSRKNSPEKKTKDQLVWRDIFVENKERSSHYWTHGRWSYVHRSHQKDWRRMESRTSHETD